MFTINFSLSVDDPFEVSQFTKQLLEAMRRAQVLDCSWSLDVTSSPIDPDHAEAILSAALRARDYCPPKGIERPPLDNPLAYAYACDYCPFECDEEAEIDLHYNKVHDIVARGA